MIIKPDTIVYDKNKAEYKVINLVGNGAFGYVYKIEKNDDKSVWALKTIPVEFSNLNLLQGLVNEANLAIKVNHKNVIKYIFFHDGALFTELPPYIIMEFADQDNLGNIIKQQKSKKQFLPAEELKNMFNQLIDGMEAINAQIIHRDIKPDNILVKDNLLKISDFGLSKIIQEQTRTYTFKGIGHIKYMAPEGWKNEKNSIKMDIYSMGIVFFELATLLHPLEVPVDDFQRWQEAHLFQVPKRPDAINSNLSLAMSQAMLKMIEKSPSVRFNSWAEVRSAFEKDKITSTTTPSLVTTLLKKKIEKDLEEEKKNLEAQKRQSEINDFKKLVKYQIEKDVVGLIEDIVNAFNREYLKGKLKVIHEASVFDNVGIYKLLVKLISGELLILEIRVLFDESFIRVREVDDYGESRMVQRLERPLLYGRKILAWGFLKDQHGRGINLLLVEKQGDIYGEWFAMINTNSALTTNSPIFPEPFAFGFSEIEKEIHTIGAMHIYDVHVEPLNSTHLLKIFEETI